MDKDRGFSKSGPDIKKLKKTYPRVPMMEFKRFKTEMAIEPSRVVSTLKGKLKKAKA